MDQKKTGQFLKMLRNEKKLTQEQLAKQFNVSNRSVSRWETGTNLPDISLLVEIALFVEHDKAFVENVADECFEFGAE